MSNEIKNANEHTKEHETQKIEERDMKQKIMKKNGVSEGIYHVNLSCENLVHNFIDIKEFSYF
jgi:hypothetical protein